MTKPLGVPAVFVLSSLCSLMTPRIARAGTAPAAALDAARPLFGAWRATDGKLLVVGRSDDALFVFDEAGAQRRRATLEADGRSLRVHDGELRLRGDGELLGRLGGRELRATRVPLGTEEAHWSNGALTLAGTLWRPAGHARTPAVVLVQGSGPETRWAMRQFPAWLAAHGVTAIAYDKRAKWQPWESGIDALAGDALGAVALLRARRDVDPARVGLLGISNGAFVVVRAAARSSDVGFIVPIVGGAGPLWRHELHRLHQAGLHAGLSASEVAALDAFMKGFYRPETFAADGKARLGQALAQARGRPWLAVTPLADFVAAPLDVAFSVGQRAWANELSYDPAADLGKLGARPALFLLAGADEDVDTALATSALSVTRPAGARVVVLAGASHYLTLPTPPPSDDAVRLSPTLFSALDAFFAQSVLPTAESHGAARRAR